MIAESLRTRGVIFAFLFGPPRVIRRVDASMIHDAVCDALGLDDIAFRYGSSDETGGQSRSGGFSVLLERSEGRGGFRARIEGHGADSPMRLLMEFTWPPSPKHVNDTFDMTGDAIFSSLDDLQKVMAEVRFRGQCDVPNGDALAFMREHLMRLDDRSVEALGGPLAFTSVGLEVSAGRETDDPLAHPRRMLNVEVLREDRRSLYLETMSQWTQLPAGMRQVPSSSDIRPIDRKPSEYVDEATTFLRQWVDTLGSADD